MSQEAQEKGNEKMGSLGISVKEPYMGVRQTACTLQDRDKYVEKDGRHW